MRLHVPVSHRAEYLSPSVRLFGPGWAADGQRFPQLVAVEMVVKWVITGKHLLLDVSDVFLDLLAKPPHCGSFLSIDEVKLLRVGTFRT